VKTHIRVTAIALAALLIACVALGIWYLRTDRFQEFARTMLVSRLEKATGLACRVERVQLDIFRGRFSIHGLELAPRTPAPGLMALQAQDIHAAISISSFWHFRIRLADLEIVRPRVKLLSGGGDTAWNPEGLLKALKMSLRLEAARVSARDGLLTINDRTSPFNLSLNNLDLEIRYSRKLPSYKIHVEYAKSRILWEERDITHDLEVSTDLSLQGIEIESFRLRFGSDLFTGSGSMKNWDSPVLLIHTAGMCDVRDLTLAHPSINEGHGKMGVVAELRFDRNGVHSKGKFTIKNGTYRKMAFHNLAGEYEVKHDVLYLRNVSGGIAQGSILVDGTIQLTEAGNGSNKVVITSKSIPLIETGRVLKLPLLTFENTADTTTTITWQHGDEDLKVDCDARLHGLEQPAAQSGNSTPFDGSIRFIYFGTGDVQVASANLTSPNSSMQALGEQGDSFRVRLSANRISEPFKFIAAISPPVADLLIRQPDVLSMAGSYRFNGTVRINSSSDVVYRGDLSIKNGR